MSEFTAESELERPSWPSAPRVGDSPPGASASSWNVRTRGEEATDAQVVGVDLLRSLLVVEELGLDMSFSALDTSVLPEGDNSATRSAVANSGTVGLLDGADGDVS